ncbi:MULTISPECIES: SH3 domain-containing protein [Fischerella]|uniref:SH3 domain-containing protein n=1 Tax=Fischerella TaxID=1190 RepID=UPI000369307F|nr:MULTISPECIES: SH3 domain-containing protein [Fischerella]MBD2435076.1 SH3 domain-containing protein [Fischerella sp. FACHB-380]
MNKFVKKLALLAVGVSLSFTSIEATTPHLAQAQKVCQSYRVTRPGGLYVYIQSGKRIITTLPYGNLVAVTGLSPKGYWARIRYLRADGLIGQGWVAARYLRCFQM